ncbi:MAG: hypothetical protein ACRDPR_18595 [Nocardioidaceae bacterium]
MRRITLWLVAATLLAGGCDRQEAERAAEPETSTTTAVPQPSNLDHDQFATTNELHVTSDGFRPATMVAVIDDPIGIVNDTQQPLVVRFTNYRTPEGLAETPPIEPGGRFSWKADSGHSAVLVADGVPGQGNIVIEPDALEEPDGGTGRPGPTGG